MFALPHSSSPCEVEFPRPTRIVPSSQELGPPATPGRFSLGLQGRLYRQARDLMRLCRRLEQRALGIRLPHRKPLYDRHVYLVVNPDSLPGLGPHPRTARLSACPLLSSPPHTPP